MIKFRGHFKIYFSSNVYDTNSHPSMSSDKPDIDEAGAVVNDLAVLALVVWDALVSVRPVRIARGGVDKCRGRLNARALLSVVRLLLLLELSGLVSGS